MDRADWDELADDFEELVVDVTRDQTSDQLSRFVAATRLPRTAVLVDLGCGIGSFIQRFGDRFAEVIESSTRRKSSRAPRRDARA